MMRHRRPVSACYSVLIIALFYVALGMSLTQAHAATETKQQPHQQSAIRLMKRSLREQNTQLVHPDEKIADLQQRYNQDFVLRILNSNASTPTPTPTPLVNITSVANGGTIVVSQTVVTGGTTVVQNDTISSTSINGTESFASANGQVVTVVVSTTPVSGAGGQASVDAVVNGVTYSAPVVSTNASQAVSITFHMTVDCQGYVGNDTAIAALNASINALSPTVTFNLTSAACGGLAMNGDFLPSASGVLPSVGAALFAAQLTANSAAVSTSGGFLPFPFNTTDSVPTLAAVGAGATSSSAGNNSLAIGLGVGLGVGGFLVLLIAGAYYLSQRKAKKAETEFDSPVPDVTFAYAPSAYPAVSSNKPPQQSSRAAEEQPDGAQFAYTS